MRVIPNVFIPVVAPDRNVRSAAKSGRAFHKNYVKEVLVHSDTKLICWAGWLTHIFDREMFLLHFSTFWVENFYVNVV